MPTQDFKVTDSEQYAQWLLTNDPSLLVAEAAHAMDECIRLHRELQEYRDALSTLQNELASIR